MHAKRYRLFEFSLEVILFRVGSFINYSLLVINETINEEINEIINEEINEEINDQLMIINVPSTREARQA